MGANNESKILGINGLGRIGKLFIWHHAEWESVIFFVHSIKPDFTCGRKEATMNRKYSIFGIILGLLGILALFYSNWKYNHSVPSIGEGLLVFLTCATIPAGFKVCCLSLDKKVRGIGDHERIFIFLGGLAVIWLSVETIWKFLVPF